MIKHYIPMDHIQHLECYFVISTIKSHLIVSINAQNGLGIPGLEADFLGLNPSSTKLCDFGQLIQSSCVSVFSSIK